MGCASSSPLPSGPGPLGPPDDSVAGKVRQTVTEMADALPVQDLLDGVTHAKDGAMHKLHGKYCVPATAYLVIMTLRVKHSPYPDNPMYGEA